LTVPCSPTFASFAALLLLAATPIVAAQKVAQQRDAPSRASISPANVDGTVGETPVILTRGPVVVMRGFPFSHSVEATGSGMRFSAAGLPGGLTCDPDTGVVSGVTAASGDFMVKFSVTNAAGTSVATQLFIADGITPIELPLVRSVNPPAAGVYRPGDNVQVAVEIDAPYGGVTVIGTPRIALSFGSVTRYATFVSQDGAGDRPVLIFSYVVAPGDSAPNGISIGASVEQNGGTIRDRMGLYCALGLPDVQPVAVRVVGSSGANDASQLVDAGTIAIPSWIAFSAGLYIAP
jgi:hypothetical protein